MRFHRLLPLVVLLVISSSTVFTQTVIRERVEIKPQSAIAPPVFDVMDDPPATLFRGGPQTVAFTRPGVQVTFTAIEVSIPQTPSLAGLHISFGGLIPGTGDLKRVVMCDSNYTVTNYKTLPYSVNATSCSNYFYVFYKVLTPAGWCNAYSSVTKYATVQLNGSVAVFTIQDTASGTPVSATITVTGTPLAGYDLASVVSTPNKTALQCNDTTRVNFTAKNENGNPLTFCSGHLNATASLIGAGNYAFLRKGAQEGQTISFAMTSASSFVDVVLDTSLAVIPYGQQQATLRVTVDNVSKDTTITFTCNYPQPSVTITYPGQDTTIILTPEHQPTLTLLETHSPTSGQFAAQVSWEPSGTSFNTANYYSQIEDSLVIPVIATATNAAQFTAKDTVLITLKKNPIDHFTIMFEKDTVAYSQTSQIYVQAKDSAGVNVDPPSGTLVNIVLGEFEQYGYLAYEDSTALLFQNIPYADAHSGSVLFTATNQNPGFGTAIVPVGVSKVGQEGVSGVDTVVVGRRIRVELLAGASTLKPLGDADNKKIIVGTDTSWVIDFAKVKSTTVTVRAIDNLEQPVEGYPFTLQALVGALSGGHDHSAGRPIGRFISGSDTVTSLQDTTDSDGTKQYTYLSSGFGGVDSLFVLGYTSSDTASKTITLKMATYTELTAGSHYELIGWTATHTKNHYGTTVLVNKLKALADSLHADSSYVLRINDMSLQWGGPFDYQANWNTPHQTHREGVSADIDDVDNNSKAIPSRYIEDKVRKKPFSGGFYPHSDHYHVTFR